MSQISISYFSCCPADDSYCSQHSVDKWKKSKTRELKKMVQEQLKELELAISVQFLFESLPAYGLSKRNDSSPFRLIQAAFGNHIVIVDASLEEEEFELFNLDFGANYECITPAVMSLDNVLILSRTQLPLNFTPLRSNVKRLGNPIDHVNKENEDKTGYRLIYSNEQIVNWLVEELKGMYRENRLFRDDSLKLDLTAVSGNRQGMEELFQKESKILDESAQYMKSRNRGDKVRCFISYRGCYYKRKRYLDKYDISDVVRKIQVHHGGNAEITVLPEGCLSNELMPEVRRWAFVSYIDRMITDCDEFWIFETKYKDGKEPEYGYWDSWWCMGEILTLLRRRNDVLENKLKVMKFDPDADKEHRISQLDISSWHCITPKENKELARYYANSDFLEAGYESVGNMRAMRRWPRFLRKIKFELIKEYVGPTIAKGFNDIDFMEEYKFEDFEESVFSHVYDKSFMENRIITCVGCQSFGATEERVKDDNFIWSFLNINGEYTQKIAGLSRPKESIILTPKMFSYLLRDDRRRYRSFVKAGGALKCTDGHLFVVYKTNDRFFVWWTPRMGKRTGPNHCVIETVPVYSSIFVE